MKSKKACFYSILATLILGSGTLLASSSSILQSDEDEQRPSSPSPLIQSLNAPSTPPDHQSNEISEQAHTLIKDDQEAHAKEKANRRALAVLSATKVISNVIKQKQEKRTQTAQKLSAGSVITDIKQEDGTTTHVISAPTKAVVETTATQTSNLVSKFGPVIQFFVERSREFLPEALQSLQQHHGNIQGYITQVEAIRPNVAEANLKTFDEGVERLKKRKKIIEDLQEKTCALILALNPATQSLESHFFSTLNYMDAETLQNTEVQTILNDIHHLTEELQKI